MVLEYKPRPKSQNHDDDDDGDDEDDDNKNDDDDDDDDDRWNVSWERFKTQLQRRSGRFVFPGEVHLYLLSKNISNKQIRN